MAWVRREGLRAALGALRSPAAFGAVVAGEIQVTLVSVVSGMAQIKSGRIKALAVLSPKRFSAAPDVPSAPESGLAGIESNVWFGLFAPAGTPRAAIDWLNAEARKAFTSPDLKARLEGMGLTLPLGSPEDFGRHVEAETKRWGEVIRKGNIKIE